MTAMPSCTSILVVGAIVAAVMAAADLANTLARSWTLKADLQGFLRRFPVHGLPYTGARIALADLVASPAASQGQHYHVTSDPAVAVHSYPLQPTSEVRRPPSMIRKWQAGLC